MRRRLGTAGGPGSSRPCGFYTCAEEAAGDRWWPWKCQPCAFYTCGEEVGWCLAT